ncbi:MAG TPA: phage holin family protein [Capsulimonadaceae bacterium]|nr:phage holin family protein [Capsulimonadaceae bacterium]
MHFILRWILSAVALYITVFLGQILHLGLWIDHGTRGVVASLITVAVLAIVNAIIRPIVELVALPITCLTLGLFSFVINAILFWVVGQVMAPFGFHVHGFLAALFGSVVMGLISGFLNHTLASSAEKERGR